MPKIANPTKPLADVNVLPQNDGSSEIVVCFMPDIDLLVGEGNSNAFLALDASASMKKMYGYGGPFGGDPNYVQAVARKLGSMLTSVAKTGRVSGIYWAVNQDGTRTERIGEFDEQGWQNALVTGPKKEKWGRGTKLFSVLRYAVEEVGKASDWTMGVVLTDGIIEDEKECMGYCLQIGKEMASGKRKPIKLILIGIGDEVDEEQLERFDNMFEGTGINYDLWSHGLVNDLNDESDIVGVLYGELMDEETIIAPSGKVQDESGHTLISWSDGMPGKFRFVLPQGEKSFTIHTKKYDITQNLKDVFKL